MNIIDNYIARSIFFTVLFVLFVLAGLDAVFSLIGEMEDLKRDYQLTQAVQYILWMLPGKIYEFIPVATLIGCLIALGNLANNSEITVMRASGISVARIVYSAFRPVALFVVVALVLVQFVIPVLEPQARNARINAMQGSNVMMTANKGHWYRDKDAFVNIQSTAGGEFVMGVSRFFFDDTQTLVASEFSERAEFKGDHWMLYNVKETRLGEARTEIAHYEKRRWTTELLPEFFNTVAVAPEQLSVTDLWSYANQLQVQGLKSNDYFFTFWKKVLQPLATFVMVFIALSFIFGPLRSVTMGQRLIAGIVTGLGFNYTQDLLGHVSIVFNVSPMIAASLPIALCLAAGLYFIRRV